jgi:translational activator of cytochrome c oxidase 1
MFIRRGFVKVSLADGHSEKVLNAALEGGAEDFEEISTTSGGTVMRVGIVVIGPNAILVLT